MEKPRLQSENLRWFLESLPGLLVGFSLMKDFLAIGYVSRHLSLQGDFVARIAMLPGSLTFWGYAGWLASVFNCLCAALVGWIASKKLLSRYELPKS